MGELPGSGRPTLARVDLAAIRANYTEVARRAEPAAVIAVVKADAYGHGAVPVVRALCEAGCRRFAVATSDEAAELRMSGVLGRDDLLLVLGGVHDAAESARVLELGATPVVHRAEHLDWLADAARARDVTWPVHLEVDTGMRRMGVPADQAVAVMAELAEQSALTLSGVYTHLARAEEPDPEPTREQLRIFDGVLDAARKRGLPETPVHVANSAGVWTGAALPSGRRVEAVRVGLALYGAWPMAEPVSELRPAMTLATRVVNTRQVRAGDAVGYGGAWRASRDTCIATLPVGYADGIPRSASERGTLMIAGRRLPLAGRVSMDFVTVDAGDMAVAVGDEAIVFGEGAGGRLPVEEAAEAAGTLAYELLTGVGARVPRIYSD